MVYVKNSESDFLMILLLFLLLLVIIIVIIIIVVVVSDCFLCFCVCFFFAAVFHPDIFQKVDGIKSFILNGLLSFDEM